MMTNKGKRATKGDTILFHYTVTLNNGKMIESSQRDNPKKITLGNKQIRTEIEENLLGMAVGDTNTVTIPAKNAYGPYRNEFVFRVHKKKLSEIKEPKIGTKYKIKEKNGSKSYNGRVTQITGNEVTLDANHKLAGKDINYKLELIKINE